MIGCLHSDPYRPELRAPKPGGLHCGPNSSESRASTRPDSTQTSVYSTRRPGAQDVPADERACISLPLNGRAKLPGTPGQTFCGEARIADEGISWVRLTARACSVMDRTNSA